MIRDENYITIQGWMRNILGLKGNELLVFSLIYGFSQDGVSEFRGSIKYIQEWTGASKNTVLKSLNSLVTSGLIIKRDIVLTENLKMCAYKVSDESMYKMKHHNCTGGAEIEPGRCKNCTGGGAEIEPNNNINNTNDINKKREDQILSFGFGESLNDTIRDWLEYKKEKKQDYKPTGFVNLLKQIGEKTREYGEAAVVECIKESMANNWQGIIWEKIKAHVSKKDERKNSFHNFDQRSYDYDDLEQIIRSKKVNGQIQ